MLKEDTCLDNLIPSTVDYINEIKDLKNNSGKEQFGNLLIKVLFI